MKWGAGQKSVQFAVNDLNLALEEHLSFVCRKVDFVSLVLVSYILYIQFPTISQDNISTENIKIIKRVLKKCNSKAYHFKLILHSKLALDHINLMKGISIATVPDKKHNYLAFDYLYIKRHNDANVDLLFESSSILSKEV